MLADVDAGSDTPSLVGKVLKWRKAESAQGQSDFAGHRETHHVLIHIGFIAYALWTALNKLNQGLARVLLSLSDMHATDPVFYMNAVKYISPLQHEQVSIGFSP